MFVLLVLLFLLLADARSSAEVQAFYYPWYGTPEHDGEYFHWRHATMGEEPVHIYPGGDDIGANFYPEGGCYSSNDLATLDRQMGQLNRAGVTVISVSWLGPESFEAGVLPALLDAAQAHDIKVNFHLEPAVQSSVATVREAIVHLIDHYGDHPAFYRCRDLGDRGLFYVYDSYNIPSQEWARLLQPDGDLTIRGTRYDGVLLGLLVNEGHLHSIEEAGFDGAYSYFAVDGFSYGATSRNWPHLARWARESGKIFVPSVGPGYSDLRIRPWNSENQRSRQNGATYDCLFQRAIASGVDIITITSFNEWHEGTQIEPAMPHSTSEFSYQDYGSRPPAYYLDRTAFWIEKLAEFQAGNWAPEAQSSTACGGSESTRQVEHPGLGCLLESSVDHSSRYPGGGTTALVDGTLGSPSYRDGSWQGFEGKDPVFTIHLKQPTSISGLEVGCLSDPKVWILPPRAIEVETSSDGYTFEMVARSDFPEWGMDEKARRLPVLFSWQSEKITHLRVKVFGQKTCPEGHPGAGQPAWLFLDELRVIPDESSP